MEIVIDPRAEERRKKDDWSARAWRVKNAPLDLTGRPAWIAVMIDTDESMRGRASFAREQLERHGVHAEVRALRGIPGSRHGNWKGFVTFARLKI